MISQTLDGIENSLDILEERCDTLEDNGVNVESFKNQLSKLWDEHEKLVESLYISQQKKGTTLVKNKQYAKYGQEK